MSQGVYRPFALLLSDPAHGVNEGSIPFVLATSWGAAMVIEPFDANTHRIEFLELVIRATRNGDFIACADSVAP